MKLYHKYLKSMVGDLQLVASDKAVQAVLWDCERKGRVCLPESALEDHHPLLLEVEKQLEEYFRKDRLHFELPLEFQGTAFQKEVWQALQQIPYGTTLSYGNVAHVINRSKAVRAIGSAIGRNPISIIVPCHRVIGHKGTLTGFAGGVDRKQILLNLEKRQP